MTKSIAPSKLTPGTAYTLKLGRSLQRATYVGVGMYNPNKTGPMKPYANNGYARAGYGDRFIFEVEGEQVLLRKAYTKMLKSGLVYEHMVQNPADTLVDDVIKFFA